MIWIPLLLASLGFLCVLCARGISTMLAGTTALFLSIALLICILSSHSSYASNGQVFSFFIILCGLTFALVGAAIHSNDSPKATKE